MNKDPRVDELLAPLKGEPPELGAPPREIDRDRVLARMSAAAKVVPIERARRTRRLVALTIAAAFAVILGVSGARRMAVRVAIDRPLDVTSVSGEVTVQGAAPQGIAPGRSARFATEGALATSANAEARIHTESGVELEVFENTRVPLAELAPQSKALHLDAGAIRCHIPRLPVGQTFSVVTPYARVVVHGTVFRVDVRGDGASGATIVRVDEGEVVVHHANGETTLVASQSWTNRPMADLPSAAPQATTIATAETPSRSATPPRGPTRRGTETTEPAPGTLDQETRLLRSGLAAERNGDFAKAAASFELLLSRYPESPLVPDARAALARVRARRGE